MIGYGGWNDCPGPDVRAAHRALQVGVDLRGLFVWSLIDNFE